MKTMIWRCILIIAYAHISMSNPTGCSYDADTVLYTCNARFWVLPLAYADFTVQPQRLLLKDVSGELPEQAPNGPTFSGFVNINTAVFDAKFTPSLHIMCYAKSSLIIFKDTFTDFGWIEEVIIQDCDILSLPVEVFSYLGDINSFTIQGGSISNIVSDSFKGLNVKKITTSLTPKGEFIIRNSQLTSGAFPFGAFFHLTNVEVIILDNNHITSFQKDTFYSNPKLTNLSLNYNQFTSVPEWMFSASMSLGDVSMWGIQWTCTCSELWFIPYAIENNITLHGDILCSAPAEHTNTRAASFYSTNCVDYSPCDGVTGVVIGDQCITVIAIVSYTLVLITTLIACIALGLVIHLNKFLKERKTRKQSVNNLKRNIAGKLAKIIENKLKVAQELYARAKYKADQEEEKLNTTIPAKVSNSHEAERRNLNTPLYWRDKTQVWLFR